MKVLVLAEGATQEQRQRREWGISILINNSILFDAFGHSEKLEENTRKYEINIQNIKNIVISHLHWDHISGLEFILKNANKPCVFIPQDTPYIAGLCKKYSAGIIVSQKNGKYKDEIFLTGAMDALFKEEKFCEQGLLLESEKGIILIVGCSHPGILKIANKAIEITGKNIYCIIGGLHLKDEKTGCIADIAESLRKTGVKKIIAGHCTGKNACDIFNVIYGDNFEEIKQGAVYTF